MRAVERGDAISVYWPKDETWYDGRVEAYDLESGVCKVLYDDGERQEVNLLKQTKYKCRVKPGSKVVELIDKVRANDGDVSKQLKDIGEVLREMSDRLPSRVCCSSRKGWWSDWYSDIGSAVEAGNLIALVKVAHDLACQLKRNVDGLDVVTTPWWEVERSYGLRQWTGGRHGSFSMNRGIVLESKVKSPTLQQLRQSLHCQSGELLQQNRLPVSCPWLRL